MNSSGIRPSSRVLVIGIDAGTMDLIKPWAEAGELPTFASLLADGASGLLRSVPNRNSAAAWTSIMTGKNPGKHGIFFFTEFQEKSLEYSYVNGSHRDGVTLWRLLSDAGLRVGVMNVPMTYPAEPVNGFLIAGMDAPSANDPAFTYPPDLRNELADVTGEYIIEVGLGSYMKSGKLDEGVEALRRTTESRLAATRHLITNRPWDFFMVVLRNPDPAQHYFWKYMEAERFGVPAVEAEKYGSVILDVYRQTDAALAELLKLIGDDTTVLIASDHGACANTASPSVIPQWLRAAGFLSEREDSSDEFRERLAHRVPGLRARTEARTAFYNIDWARTKAFADGRRPEIWVNLRSRQPNGTVEPGEEYRQVCNELVSLLSSASNADTGRLLVERVYRREEVYNGPHSERSADLIIDWRKDAVTDRAQLADGLVVNADSNRPAYLPELPYSGVHDPMGILFMRGPAVQPGATPFGATVTDIAPTVLYLLGEPVPADMDGRVLLELLRPEVIAAHAPVSTTSQPGAGSSGYSESDEAVIGERLRGLGYIE